jgi:hypothetical protein
MLLHHLKHHTLFARVGFARIGATVGGVLLVAATALAGCTIGGTGATATPTSTATPTPAASATPTPGMPTLSYKIVTQAGNTALQAIPAIALPVSSGTNFQWVPSGNFQGLACTAKGTADPGGAAGRTVYQVFLCQLAAGQTAGTGSFIFTEVGSTVAQKLAQVEVESTTAQQGAPILNFAITTSQFGGAASLALTVSNGTPFEWTPATDFVGLTCQPGGNADPGSPSGHPASGTPYYQVFACQLAAGQSSGQGSLLFVAQHMNPPAQPTYTAQIKVTLG